ncbi:MAG: ParB/RepB/Spo0J family partition protein [Vicinamibacterales bacterium]
MISQQMPWQDGRSTAPPAASLTTVHQPWPGSRADPTSARLHFNDNSRRSARSARPLREWSVARPTSGAPVAPLSFLPEVAARSSDATGDERDPRIADQSLAVVLGDGARRNRQSAPSRRADPRARERGRVRLLIAGARRLRAAKLAGCESVPARVLDLDDAAADEATIIENLHREDIHLLDEGVSYQRLVSAGWTIEDTAAALGKSRATSISASA